MLDYVAGACADVKQNAPSHCAYAPVLPTGHAYTAIVGDSVFIWLVVSIKQLPTPA
jgi:hypothetical protein